MVRFLGPAPFVKVILDKLDSLYGWVSTFDVMMQSVTHYVARLEEKVNEIQVKHPNRISEAETTMYIWDNIFYGLRKLLWESIHATFDNSLNDYMALMWVARKAEGEHDQEKHNT